MEEVKLTEEHTILATSKNLHNYKKFS